MSEEKVEGEEGAQASWTGNVWQSLGGLRMDVFVRIGNGRIFNSWWTVRISSEIAVTADALKQKTALTLNADPVIGPMWCSGKSSWSWDSVMCCQSPLKLSLRSGPLSDKTSWRKRWVVLLALHYLKVPPHIHPGFFSNLKKMWHLRVWKSTEKLCHPSSHQIFFKNKDWGAAGYQLNRFLFFLNKQFRQLSETFEVNVFFNIFSPMFILYVYLNITLWFYTFYSHLFYLLQSTQQSGETRKMTTIL